MGLSRPYLTARKGWLGGKEVKATGDKQEQKGGGGCQIGENSYPRGDAERHDRGTEIEDQKVGIERNRKKNGYCGIVLQG